MTAFEDAAKLEAASRWRLSSKPNADMQPIDWLNEGMNIGFTLGAMWARDYLAQQEPTDADEPPTAAFMSGAAWALEHPDDARSALNAARQETDR